jgi:hypothetical protein
MPLAPTVLQEEAGLVWVTPKWTKKLLPCELLGEGQLRLVGCNYSGTGGSWSWA